mgnify:CR=1 FL=1
MGERIANLIIFQSKIFLRQCTHADVSKEKRTNARPQPAEASQIGHLIA